MRPIPIQNMPSEHTKKIKLAVMILIVIVTVFSLSYYSTHNLSLHKIPYLQLAHGTDDDDNRDGKGRHHSSLNIPNNYNTLGNVETKSASDVIKGEGLIIGTNADNYIIGSVIDDTIFGKDGNDLIQALGGEDTVYSGGGDDTVYGGDGNNQLFGEDGKDNIIGGPFEDLLSGGNGDDHLIANFGDDTMMGGAGANFFDCGAGIDTILDYNPDKGDVISNQCEIVNNIDQR